LLPASYREVARATDWAHKAAPALTAAASWRASALVVPASEFESRQDMLEFMTTTIGNVGGITDARAFVLLGVLKRLGESPTHSKS
jgi:hypothetical protein